MNPRGGLYAMSISRRSWLGCERWNAWVPAGEAVLIACLFLLLPSAHAKDLMGYREPNRLELAYVGVAADLQLPNTCQKISPNALHRVRKPTLARSHCYYYLALNSADTSWCELVEPIPYGAGVMSWLDPERCRYQVGRLAQLEERFPFRFDQELLLREMGYAQADIPERYRDHGRIRWDDFYRGITGTGARADFVDRLDRLPDFSKTDRAEDQPRYYTAEQMDRELDWVMMRAMKLCLEGRISKDCRERFAQLRPSPLGAGRKTTGAKDRKTVDSPTAEEEGSRRDTPSGYREVSQLERAYYDIAVRLGVADWCRRISSNVVGIGWSIDPGFLFIPVRSACLTAVAVKTKNDKLCDQVRPLDREDLDGSGLTAAYCRDSVEDLTKAVYETTLKPDWRHLLPMLGYSETNLPEDLEHDSGQGLSWLTFADRLIDPKDRRHAEFLERLANSSPLADRITDLDLSESDLRRHLYQLSVIRFHCSINRYGDRYLYKGYSLQPPKKFGGPFELMDPKGSIVTDEDFHGRYLLVFFGYTACPDICPTNLVTVAQALESLGEIGERIQPLFVSVDSKRDTPEQLGTYTRYFHPRLLGLTGTPEQLRRAAKAYQAHYFAGEVDGAYVVDHTAWTYLVGPDGRPIDYFDHGTSAEDMAAKIRKVVGGRALLASEAAGG